MLAGLKKKKNKAQEMRELVNQRSREGVAKAEKDLIAWTKQQDKMRKNALLLVKSSAKRVLLLIELAAKCKKTRITVDPLFSTKDSPDVNLPLLQDEIRKALLLEGFKVALLHAYFPPVKRFEGLVTDPANTTYGLDISW